MKNKLKTEARYLKIAGTGQIVKIRNFSAITQLYDVEAADGKISTVQSNQVSQQVSPEDVSGFIKLQGRRSG